MAKKKEFVDEELIVETENAAEEAVETVAEAAQEVKEAVEEVAEVVAEEAEPEAEDEALDADEYEGGSEDDLDYDEVEDILMIEEAEKKRTLRKLITFIGIGIAVAGVIAAIFSFLFRDKD